MTFQRSSGPKKAGLQEASSSGRSARILLVEDLPANQELACAMLAKIGHEVVTANDGFSALEAARTGEFDLILMDIQMPRMDGFEATRAIRAMPGAAGRVPIVAMTANVLPAQVMQFRAVGMDGHVAKPVRQAELARSIAHVLKRASPKPPELLAAGGGGEERLFDADVWNQVYMLLPPDRLGEHLDGLTAEIRHITAAGASAPDVGSRAHQLVSVAGSLGFLQLSKASARLEEAAGAADRESSAAAFDAMRGVAAAALPKIAELRASL